MDIITATLVIVGACVALHFFFFLVPFPLWVSARLSGVQVGLFELFVMRVFRRIPPHQIITPAIADIEVGENIGARLQIDQAEADKKVAQAKAEERLSNALATHAEMTALRLAVAGLN